MHTDIALDPTFYAVANIDGGIAAYVSPAARHTTGGGNGGHGAGNGRGQLGEHSLGHPVAVGGGS